MSPEVEAIAQRHRAGGAPIELWTGETVRRCVKCRDLWPCDTALVLAELGWNPDTEDTP